MALIPCKECGRSISDRAVSCPQCGAPVAGEAHVVGLRYGGYEWRTRTELFGLPLVHVASGWGPNGVRRVARGIIAVGDIAFGVIAVGGAAFGGLAVGGFSFGLAALGGLAVGLGLGLGGFAIGYAALGGLAIGYYSIGGLALGPHPIGAAYQDPEALQFFRRWLGPAVDQFGRHHGVR